MSGGWGTPTRQRYPELVMQPPTSLPPLNIPSRYPPLDIDHNQLVTSQSEDEE